MVLSPSDDNVGYYYPQGDVSNLTIEVVLKRLSSSDLIAASPLTEATTLIRREAEPRENYKRDEAYSEAMEVTWMRKMKSPTEKKSEEENGGKEKRLYTVVETSGEEEEDENEEERKRINQSSPVFLIMADFAPTELLGQTQEYQMELCRLSLTPNGELRVCPDFIHEGDGPYRKHITGETETDYQYTVKNVSKTRDCGWRKKVTTNHSKSPIPLSVGEMASLPPGVSFTMTLCGEITRVRHCKAGTRVYITFCLHLPLGWYCIEGVQSTEGMSHSCLTVTETETLGTGGDTETVFCLPINLTLAAKVSNSGWPYLLIAAFEIESNEREKELGYTAIRIPLTSEESITSSPLTLPSLTSPQQQLMTFFLPGCRKPPTADYFIPGEKEVSRQSRYGSYSESNASVETRLMTILSTGKQNSQAFHPSLSSPDVRTVLEKFRKSTRRLKLLRDSIQKPQQ